jgi:hypothetical protein
MMPLYIPRKNRLWNSVLKKYTTMGYEKKMLKEKPFLKIYSLKHM